MTTTSRLHRWQGDLRRVSGRAPLRVKMITALLALVIIALAIISIASLSVFRNYLQTQSGNQVTTLYNQRTARLSQNSQFGPPGGLSSNDFGYYGTFVVELLNAKGQVIAPFGPMGSNGQVEPGPDVPTSAAWLKANAGQLVTVGGTSGSGSWQVITTKPLNLSLTNNYTGQSTSTQNVILVVGTSLATIDNTVGHLARSDE